MNIGINTRLLLQHRLEGIGWHAYELISRLIALNPQHRFFLFYDRKQNIIIPEGNNVQAISLSPASRHPILIHAWCEYALSRALIQYKIDVFYSPEVLMPGDINIPSIITVHDLSPVVIPASLPWSHRVYYQYLIKRNLSLADKIITVSNFSKQEIMATYAIAGSKIEVVYNAARTIFKPTTAEQKSATQIQFTQGCPYFISVGSIHQRKNIDKVIAAFEAFKNKTLSKHKLVLVGKSMGLSATAKHAIVKSTYKEDILSTGYIPDERLVLLLSGAEALINLSDYEGFGMPIVEAMACAVPVIAADKSCFPEICGDAALFVEPHDSSQVSHGMEKCLKERDEWVIRVGHRLKSFNWDGSAHKVSVMINTLKVS